MSDALALIDRMVDDHYASNVRANLRAKILRDALIAVIGAGTLAEAQESAKAALLQEASRLATPTQGDDS